MQPGREKKEGEEQNSCFHRSIDVLVGHLKLMVYMFLILGSRKTKEPKFVPYEPYKAAITPLAPLKKKSSRGSIEVQPLEHIQDPPVDEIDASNIISEGPFKLQKELYEKAINDLTKKLEETEKQFRIQCQVNNEVKKLLVASVGEDIEAKVDFLTQDKARLAADIRQYSNKISRDFEEKENLNVQSDLWKSKFLASSVIVDELARWKGRFLD